MAQNKTLDSDIVFVLPIEITPFVEKELTANVESVTETGVDKDDEPYTVTVDTSAAVEADWLRIGHTNRRTSPDVRRGERVMLYRYSDSEELFWDSMGMDDHLRKLETVIWSWSATKEEYPDADSTDTDKSYTLEVSTHNKLVTFRTTKADGEPYAYHMQFDTEYGNFVVTDDVGNYMQIDSPETIITLKNKDGTEWHLDKKDIIGYAPRDINVTCDRDYNLNVGRNYNIVVGNNFNLDVGNVHYSEAKTKMQFKVGGSVTTLLPGKTSIIAPIVEING